jgi:hypothetical protein
VGWLFDFVPLGSSVVHHLGWFEVALWLNVLLDLDDLLFDIHTSQDEVVVLNRLLIQNFKVVEGSLVTEPSLQQLGARHIMAAIKKQVQRWDILGASSVIA